MLVRPELTVVTDHIISDRSLYRSNIGIADLWYLFRFQASEEALCWGIVPAIATATETQCHSVAPEHLPKCPAGVLATLIRMKQDIPWLSTRFIGHGQRFLYQLRVRR